MISTDLNWLAVILGAVAAFGLGMVWFSPLMFGKAWAPMLRLPLIPCALALALSLPAVYSTAAQDTPACDQDLQTAQIRCHLDEAIRAGSAGPCVEAEDETVRFTCITLFAERSGNADACRLIGSDDLTGTLQNACVAGVAVATRDPSVCDQVGQPELTDACFTLLVLERGSDPSLCQRVQNPLLREACTEPQ